MRFESGLVGHFARELDPFGINRLELDIYATKGDVDDIVERICGVVASTEYEINLCQLAA